MNWRQTFGSSASMTPERNCLEKQRDALYQSKATGQKSDLRFNSWKRVRDPPITVFSGFVKKP